MTANRPALDWAPDLLAFLRRSWKVLALSCAAALGLGAAYMLTATPRFTASSNVMVDVQAGAPFRQQTAAVDSQYANGIAESQAEVLGSIGLAREVVRTLKLADDQEFLENGRSHLGDLLAIVMAPFSAKSTLTAESRESDAAELLTRMIKVKRIGVSFILDLDVTSHSAALSARLANALVDAFAESGLSAKSVNTRRAGLWMQGRVGELQTQAVDADSAVQAFKAQAGIVDTDKGLMNERHLGELNSQLVLARARVADTKARLDRITQLLAAGAPPGDVSDALANTVIIHLREQYVDVARQAAEWQSKLGPTHVAVVQAQAKLHDIEVQIQQEVRRIADGTASDYAVALSNQTAIEAQLASLVADADRTNVNLVQLRALQSRAATYNAIYGDFLQRYTQAVQDQSFPISDVRVVTRAAVPSRQSWPKGLIVLGGALALGLMLGFAIAMMREALDRSLRDAGQVRALLGLPCLGVLPVLKLRKPARLDRRAAAAPVSAREIAAPPPILRQAVLQPFSPYAEVIRGLRTRIERTREGRREMNVIGFVSALPGEGKSTVSANFAFSLAQAGVRTLLVDGDLRRHTLSRTLAPDAAAGIAEIHGGSAGVAEAIWHDPSSGLSFLPSAAAQGQARGLAAPLTGLHGPLTEVLLTQLRAMFDTIIIDLPPMTPVADAAAATPVMAGVVMVIEWGKTSRDVVQECLENAGIAPQRLLGVVLNRSELDTVPYYPNLRPAPAARALTPA